MSSRGIILAAIVLLAGLHCARADDPLPADVKAYVDRRTGCNYWLSERGETSLRKIEIARNIREMRCSSLDHDESEMNARYRGKPDILSAIADAHDAMPD